MGTSADSSTTTYKGRKYKRFNKINQETKRLLIDLPPETNCFHLSFNKTTKLYITIILTNTLYGNNMLLLPHQFVAMDVFFLIALIPNTHYVQLYQYSFQHICDKKMSVDNVDATTKQRCIRLNTI